MPDVVFTPTVEPMPTEDNVELGLVMQAEPDFLIVSGADDLVVESSGYSLTFSPEPASVTFSSFVGLGDEYVWYCPTLETLEPWSDLSPSINLDLTPYNANITTDAGGSAYTFTGSESSYATNWANSTNPSEFSYSFWVKGPASSSEVDGVVSQSEFNNNRGSLVGSYQNSSQGGNGSKVHFFYQSNPTSYNSAQRLQSIATVFDSTWHHVVVTFQGGSRVNIYADGVLDNTTSSSVPSQISDVWKFELGRYAGSGAFAGSLDDVRVYTRVITATEAAWLSTYRGILGEPAPPPVGLGDEKLWLCPTHSNSAMDLSGNGNNGTYIGGMGTVFDSGAGGVSAYDFDGSNQAISTPFADTTITSTGVFSYSCWVKYDVIAAQGLMSCNIQTQRTGVSLHFDTYDATRGHTGLLNPNLPSQYSARIFAGDRDTVSVGQWYHVAYTGDGTTARLYVDGVEVASGAQQYTTTAGWTQPLNLGRYFTGSSTAGGYLNGRMDDARVFTRPLTSDEITHLATARGVQGPPVSGYLDPFANPVFQNQFFSSKVIR